MSQAFALPPGTQILGVIPGFTRNNKPKFDVQCSDGQTWTGFQPELRTKAENSIGQPGTIMVSRSDDGKWKNFEDFLPGAPQAGQAFVAAPPQVQQALPVFVDKKDIEIRRSVALKAAAPIIAALAGTGYYLSEEGALDVAKIEAHTLSLTALYGRYLAEGPAAKQAGGTPVEEPTPLPPGVTPEQVQAWAAENGATVSVGAPVAAVEAAPAAAAY